METSAVTEPSPPPSPGIPPCRLEDCIEELLKFTLVSSAKGSLDTGLSADYCNNILKEDLSNPSCDAYNPTETFGVPSYPLYKCLALSIFQSLSSGTLCVKNHELPLQEESSLKQKEYEWNKLIMEKGPELLNMLKTVDFELHVQEPFFSQLNDGLKTVEGRCAVGDYTRIKSGSLILFNKCLMLEVQDVRQYASFSEMLEAESVAKVLPGVKTIEEGVQVYRKFYTKEKENLNGVIGICVTKPTTQLYNSMASILSGLSYGGIQRLLGFVQTVGTMSEALPPPPSTLISSFSSPNNPHVNGSTLSDGARALAKHVNRSSDSYWGTLFGNDSQKNKLALDIIRDFLTHSTWLNMHIVTPHGVVFEIRNTDGYGARWSEDGTKFIGFLEPYMVDGHLKRWKH